MSLPDPEHPDHVSLAAGPDGGAPQDPAVYRQLVESMTDCALVALDAEGRVATWSASAGRITGHAAGEALGRPLAAFYPPADAERGDPGRALRTAREEGRFEEQRWWVGRDGSRLRAGISIVPLRDAAVDSGGFALTVRDLTGIVAEGAVFGEEPEPERSNDAQEAPLSRLRQVIDTLPIGIFLLDPAGEIVWHNPAGRRLWGGTRRVGVDSYDTYRAWWTDTGQEVEVGEWAAVRALEGEQVTGQMVDIEAFDGSRRTVLNSAFPLGDAAERISAVMVVNEDITERRRLEADLRRQHGYVALLQEIAVAANEAASVEEAFAAALEHICDRTGCPVGHVLVGEASGEMVSTGILHLAEPERLAGLRSILEGTRVAPGHGLPGHAVEAGRAVCADRVEQAELRAEAAAEVGLRPALAVPIRVGAEVVGALEFFSSGPFEPDASLLEVLGHAGTQLGRVVERGRALDALRESEERFRLMFQRSPLPNLVIDRDTLRILDVNDAALRHYGYSREQFLAMTARDLCPDVEAEGIDALYRESDGPVVGVGGMRHRTRDGADIHVEVTAHDIGFAGRRARLAVILDVTERIRAEERQRFLLQADQSLASTPDFEARIASFARLCVPRLADLCVVDVVEDSGEARRVEATHEDPARDEAARELLLHPPRPGADEVVARVLRTGKAALIPDAADPAMAHAAQDDGHREVLARLGVTSLMVLPLTAHGRTLGAVTFAMAGSDRRFGEEHLRHAEELARRAALLLHNGRLYRDAQRARQAREEVLAVASHELRSPLNSILLLAEILLDVLPPEAWRVQQRRQLESIRGSAEQMARLVDDLLDVTRIEAGHLSLRREPAEVAPLVEAVLESFRPAAVSRALRLDSRVDSPLPPVAADPQRIRQVLANLIQNALHATPEGGEISVTARGAPDRVRFSVSDTGPGIPHDQLPHLFDRFWRGPGRSIHTGLGLGLAIARGIVQAHGGRIWGESRIGAGTTFVFDIPVVSPEEDGQRQPGSDDPSDPGVIIVGPDPSGPAPPGSAAPPRQTGRDRAEASGRHARFLAELGGLGGDAGEPAPLEERLRQRIMDAIHTGRLRTGDRVPSVREVSRELGVTNHAVVQAYSALESEQLVEKRERSGIFVARHGDPGRRVQGETPQWIADLLGEACEYQIKIPQLSDLIRRLTSTVRLRCACVESDSDHLTMLCAETGQQFGLDSTPVHVDRLPPHSVDAAPDPAELPPELRDADVVVTTVFHAPRIQRLLAETGKPLIVGSVHPDVVRTLEQRLRGEPLTMVCADPRFGERFPASLGSPFAQRVRVVTADDRAAIAALDPDEPVFCTRAAYEPVRDARLRLLVPLSPFLSPQCARDLIEVLVRLNMEAGRSYARTR